MAGEFEGKSNIRNKKSEIKNGINYLVQQYKIKTKNKKDFDNSEIIFQNHVSNTLLSGVVTNRCIKDGTDYYVINYDDTFNKTNTVTSGGKKSSRVLNVYKNNLNGLRSKNLKKLFLL